MKHSKLLRAFLCLLALVLLCGTMGCTPSPDAPSEDGDKEPGEGAFDPEKSLIIAQDGVVNYQIIRSDLKSGDTAERAVSVMLRDTLQEMAQGEPGIGTDYDGEHGGTPRKDCEFLIGEVDFARAKVKPVGTVNVFSAQKLGCT